MDISNFTKLGNQQLYQKMIEEVQDYAILLLDVEGNIQNWNKGVEKIKGYSQAEIIGKNFSMFYLPEDRASNLPKTLLNEALTNGRAMHEGWRVRKDGSTFWGSIVITALHGDGGSVIGFTKVTRDLTERKLAEEEKDRNNRDIEIQNRQLEEFAYITSHDLQEPIRKIQIFISLVRENIENTEVLENYLTKMDASAKKMVSLIRSILDFSRLSQNKSQFVPVDLTKIINEVIEEFELLVQEKNVHFHLAPLPIINAVPVQMHQLFSNLIHNAIKFNNHEPSIDVGHEVMEVRSISGEVNQYHIIRISDNGIGFDQQYSDIAFHPFKRLTSDYLGAGIGLAICKRIVENHNGTITVSSLVGKGTTFTVSLRA